jgi:hypothetical protein
MTPEEPHSPVRVSVTQGERNGPMMVRLLAESGGDVYQLSLAQARALSLELIKQVHRLEARRHLKHAP